MAANVTAASKLAESRRAAGKRRRTRAAPDDDFDGTADAGPKRRRRKAQAKTGPASGPFVIGYTFAGMTKNKVRYDADDPDECHGADRQYLSKESLGCGDDDDKAPQTITVTIELG